eukprot:45811-Hanusia_phi.AAC.1
MSVNEIPDLASQQFPVYLSHSTDDSVYFQVTSASNTDEFVTMVHGHIGNASEPPPCKEILVKTPSDGPKEWTMIEMQGMLVARDSSDCLDGLDIGNLQMRKGDKNVSLVIGNQRLEGKIVDLSNPLAVMLKGKSESFESGQSATEYSIAGIIKKKIVFNHRAFKSLRFKPEKVDIFDTECNKLLFVLF